MIGASGVHALGREGIYCHFMADMLKDYYNKNGRQISDLISLMAQFHLNNIKTINNNEPLENFEELYPLGNAIDRWKYYVTFVCKFIRSIVRQIVNERAYERNSL